MTPEEELVALKKRVREAILDHEELHSSPCGAYCPLNKLFKDLAPKPVDPYALLKQVRGSLTYGEAGGGVVAHLRQEVWDGIDAALKANESEGKG